MTHVRRRVKRPDRTERFNLALTKQERRMLDELANRDGVLAAAVVRRLVREAHKAIKRERAA